MKIHSLESFGTVDGPGVRFIVFTQGCPLRCIYCHNPDTWEINGGKEMSVPELFSEILKYRDYIAKGGVTVSGGEPLLQAKEVRELFELCKKERIHTALDTTGILLNDEVKELLNITDLVLLDIKSIDPEQHKIMTGGVDIKKPLQFLDYLEENNVKCWLRHVVVPNYTDNDNLLQSLAKYLEKFSVIERVELLPYHNLAVSKYENMNIKYPLEGVEALSHKRINEIKPMFSKCSK